MELKSIQIQTVHNLRKGIDQNSSCAAYIAGIPFKKRHELLINVVLIKVKKKKAI
jgi:hypothetical protein